MPGKRCGTIGTVGAALGERRWPLVHTTPLPPELHGLLAEMHDAGAAVVAMEVSSHALALGRVDDVRFRVAALTNVTRDHLDFHPTVHAYAAAKRRLFEMSGEAVLNVDDRYGARWARELGERGVVTTTYGERSGRLSPGQLLATPEGSRFVLDGQWFDVRIPGRFNVLNALAAIGIARALGVDDATIAARVGAARAGAGKDGAVARPRRRGDRRLRSHARRPRTGAASAAGDRLRRRVRRLRLRRRSRPRKAPARWARSQRDMPTACT